MRGCEVYMRFVKAIGVVLKAIDVGVKTILLKPLEKFLCRPPQAGWIQIVFDIVERHISNSSAICDKTKAENTFDQRSSKIFSKRSGYFLKMLKDLNWTITRFPRI